MIKKIIKSLCNNPSVSNYKIVETHEESYQQFYVLHKFETLRKVDVVEYLVTVYTDLVNGDSKLVGSSSFKVTRNMKQAELDSLINDACVSAKLATNKYYDLVKPVKKKKFNQKCDVEDINEALKEVANIYFNACHDNIMINALELFYNVYTIRVVNSLGVDLTKVLREVFIEAIPSSHGEEKTEVYKSFKYSKFDFNQIRLDALNSVEETINRSKAVNYSGVKNCDIILQGYDLQEFISEIIRDYSYTSVYKKQNVKSIGDALCDNATGDLLNVELTSGSKVNGFDNDGVLLKNTKIIDNGKVVSYFGNNQYASYLGVEPTGQLTHLDVKKGSMKYQSMIKKNSLEIISLSGIQLEMYSDYIGGEIRLALYNDGKNIYPVTQLSFSGKISEVLKDMKLSKEMISLGNYSGPKYLKLKNLDIL